MVIEEDGSRRSWCIDRAAEEEKYIWGGSKKVKLMTIV